MVGTALASSGASARRSVLRVFYYSSVTGQIVLYFNQANMFRKIQHTHNLGKKKGFILKN